MSGIPTYTYYYGRPGSAVDTEFRTRLDDRYFHASKDRFESLVLPAGRTVPTWAQDLLRIAKAVHLADRKSERDTTIDNWTRHIDLVVQVEDPDPWEGPPLEDVHHLLETLTSDRWQIRLWPGAPWEGPQDALFSEDPVHKVALYSGGLDSTSYAAEQIRLHHERVLFVTYSLPKLQQRQLNVFESISDSADYSLRPIPQQVSGVERNLSNRSRGLLFIATAVYAAATHGSDEVAVPENGQLAVNPPLTPARLAACSTRSVHPRVLMLINRIVDSVSGQRLKVHNPYLFLSKGQVCKRAIDVDVRAEILADTVSCASPPVLRQKGAPNHCGYCFPCLVRQSALLASAGIDHTTYLRKFWKMDPTKDSADDAYALRRWLSRPFTARDLIADVALPSNVNRSDLLNMFRTGRKELSDMIEKRVPSEHPFRAGRAAYTSSSTSSTTVGSGIINLTA